ncbi:MAG: ABC transporter ATP-binding protein [Actinomycetes bacterium]
MDAGAQWAIEVAGLEKTYGERRAVDGIALRVATGEVFGILGPNGAGKTTTVEVLEGYRRADAGTVRVLGLDPWSEGETLRPRIGVMLQSGGLSPGLRTIETLRLYTAFYDGAEDPDALLARVGLTAAARTPVRRLSGGQYQRLSLALALVGRPEVLFLDEPTAGMDPRARATTWDLIRGLRDAGTTIVLTTHYLDEAESLCDRIVIVDHGRVVASGTPDELTGAAPRHEIRFSSRPGLDLGALADAVGVPVTACSDAAGEYRIAAASDAHRIGALASHLVALDAPLDALTTGRTTLEDVFLQLTEEDA